MAGDDNDDDALKRLTVRELRERAVKSLGSKATGLKTKGELVAALSGDWGAAAERKKPVAAVAAVAKAASVTPVAPALRAPVAELPVARDFFIDPKRPALPSAYGDDRLLCFRREPLAMVVSWDLSTTTWDDGQGVWLELIEAAGRLVARAEVLTPTGLKTFEQLPEGKALVPQVVRKGRVMTRGRAFTLGRLIEDDLRYQLTVASAEALPSRSAPGAARESLAPQPYQGTVTAHDLPLAPPGVSATSPGTLPFSPTRV